MSYYSDQELSQQINQQLTELLSEQHQVVSNSLLISTKDSSSKLIYVANLKSKSNQINNLALVSVDLSPKSIRQTVKILELKPVTDASREVLSSDKGKVASVKLIQNSYVKQMFAMVMCFHSSYSRQTEFKLLCVFKSDGAFDSKSKPIEFQQIFMHENSFQDVIWHPFVFFGLVILFPGKVIFHNLEKGQQFEINLHNNRRITYCGNQPKTLQTFKKLQMAKEWNNHAVPKDFNGAQGCPNSLWRKLTLFLVTNDGEVFSLFPLFCDGLIINEQERNGLNKMINKPSSRRENEMGQVLNGANFSPIDKDQETENQMYCLNIESNFLDLKYNIFPSMTPDNKSSQHQTISDFHVFSILDHTVFVSCVLDGEERINGIIKVCVYTSEPFKHFVASSDFLQQQRFRTQSISEIIGERIKYKPKSSIILELMSIQGNSLYLSYNNSMQCFKVNLDGFVRMLKGNKQVTSISSFDLIAQVKKGEVKALANNQHAIVLLRHTSGGYQLNTIPMQSIPLKEKIQKAKEETEELFDKFRHKCQRLQSTHVNQEKNSNDVIEDEIKQFEKVDLHEIQKKLQNFSDDFKQNIEKQLFEIKNYYEEIQSKKQKLQIYNSQKQVIQNLILKAEQNDSLIKQLISDKGKGQRCRTEKQISRRVTCASRTVQSVKSAIQKENRRLKGQPAEREEVEENSQQAQGVLQELLKLKAQLISKKKELLRAK